MKKTNCYTQATDRRVFLHIIEWTPDDNHIKGIIQIVHGLTECAERYEGIAEYFVQRGYAVVVADICGHGESVRESDNPTHYDWEYLVYDVMLCHNMTIKHFGELPVCLLGYGFGSYIVRDFISRYPQIVDSAVLVGTGYENRLNMELDRFAAVLDYIIYGDKHSTHFVRELLRHYTDLDGDYDVSSRLLVEWLDGMIYTSQKRDMKQIGEHFPILLLSGDSDPVGKHGKGVETLAKRLEQAKCDVTTQIVIGGHDILRDKYHEEIMKFLADWIEANT